MNVEGSFRRRLGHPPLAPVDEDGLHQVRADQVLGDPAGTADGGGVTGALSEWEEG